MSGHAAYQPIVVTHAGGVSFEARIRSHTLVVDQPQRGGGEDAGPMPIELLGAALGTCVALYVKQFLHSRGLPYEGMRVEVDQHKAQNPNRIATFVVRVILPEALPTEYSELLERVARGCPAHNTFKHAADVAVSIVTPVTAG